MLTTFVLGAGFSRVAGLPLGDELFQQILARSRKSHLYRNFLAPDLRRYQAFRRDTTGVRQPVNRVKLEDFMSFLDIEHSLGLSGKDTWSRQGNKSQMVVRNLIADVLWRAQRRARKDALEVYDDFARRLDGLDVIITFNYDTLLEESLERVGKKYRLFPVRQQKDEHGWHVVSSNDEVTIFKMHGSIDWFDRSHFDEQSSEWTSRGYGIPPDEVFSRETFKLIPLIDCPAPESSLTRIYRMRTLRWYLEAASMVRDAPLLISPSFSKILYANPLKEFWYGFGSGANYASKIVVIGFSLPAHDEYVRQAIYTLITNFQFGDPTANTRKAKLALVDRRASPEEISSYRDSFRFVDWDETQVILNGFGREAFGSIFDVPAD